jgi:Skp family chaperone for outer membrane proteins
MDTTAILVISTAILGLGLALCLALAINYRLELGRTRRTYAPIIDAETRVRELAAEAGKHQAAIDRLRTDYAQKRQMLDALIRHAAIYDETIELAEIGFYTPHFDFDTSERFKQRIAEVRARQKDMVRNKTAVICRNRVDG